MIRISISRSENLEEDKAAKSKWLYGSMINYFGCSTKVTFARRNSFRQICLFGNVVGADLINYDEPESINCRTFGLVTRGKLLV